MMAENSARGGAPVGHVSDLGPVEIRAVLYMRLWFAGPEAQGQVCEDFAALLGQARGYRAMEAFQSLCALCVQYSRRPLMHHHVKCKCLGADESCFANFVGYACEGAREDAFLMAVHMVRPDIAASLVDLATAVGLAFKCMTDGDCGDGETVTNATIH